MKMQSFEPIHHAELEWQNVDGVEIPVSKQFGDVYFSKANGLLETRHVFLQGNELDTRLALLDDGQTFTVGETGFGTGLNFLALWQLWQQVRPDNSSWLHFISVEKYPLSIEDLTRALAVWDELRPLTEQLLAQYPLPLAGCHRLSFPDARISLDLWFGDAAQCFPCIHADNPVNAWFLDGFAPSCNPDMWQTNVFAHIMRLSAQGTSFASFSVAGVLKRALKAYEVSISRPKGFGHKREMLKAIWQQNAPFKPPTTPPKSIAIIGAGIAGLNCAWHLAERGITVIIFDKSAPLAGGSGNPLALLNPKLCSIEHVAEHLMTTSWQYALSFYAQFDGFRRTQIIQYHEKNIEQAEQICTGYPQSLLHWQPASAEQKAASVLHQAACIEPHIFAQQVLAHPRIHYQQSHITRLEQQRDASYLLYEQDNTTHFATHVIACNALDLNGLLPITTTLKAIRGQVSWSKLTQPLPAQEMNRGYSYGGYAMPLDAENLIFGASFLPHDSTIDIRQSDHQHNFALLEQALPMLSRQLEPSDTWQGRAALRAQTPDYLPLAGQVNNDEPNLYCLAGLGSKGFLFAPLCSAMISSQILGLALPVPHALAHALRPTRFRKKPISC